MTPEDGTIVEESKLLRYSTCSVVEDKTSLNIKHINTKSNQHNFDFKHRHLESKETIGDPSHDDRPQGALWNSFNFFRLRIALFSMINKTMCP